MQPDAGVLSLYVAGRRQNCRSRLRQQVRVVANVVQAATLFSLQRTAHHQIRHLNQIPQLQEMIGEAEVTVILIAVLLRIN